MTIEGSLTYQWPDTEHPALAGQAPTIRRMMAKRRSNAIRYLAPPARSLKDPNLFDPLAPTDNMRIMNIHRAWGPAPYAGDPFVYMWDVAIDDLGRWIAGPTRIQYIDSN